MHSSSDPPDRIGDPLPGKPETRTGTPAHPKQNDALSGGESTRGWVTAVRNFFSKKLVLLPEKGLTFEEIYKRRLFSNLIIPGIVILLTFGLKHLFNKNYLEGCLDLIAGFLLIFSVLWLRQMKKGLVIYRINSTMLSLLFIFLAASGGTGGNKILWVFSYPLIAFYTLGIYEGLLWTTTLYAVISGILFLPLNVHWAYAYNSEFKIRFCVAFFLVASLSYIYESVRAKSQSSLENERAKLETEKRKLAAMTRSEQAANRALKQSERRLKQAQSIAQVGNFEYDVDEGLFWGSEEALRILDLDSTSGRIPLAYLKDKAPGIYTFLYAYKKSEEGESKLHLESTGRLKTKLQETVVCAWTELELSHEGSPNKVIGVIQDITAQDKAEKEMKELEAKLVRSQKMEALGLLAGGVAHDLNNVLSGIVSYPDLLLTRLPEDSDLKKPLGTMRDSGQKAAAIVQDLLTLARRGVTNYEVLNLNELIDECLQSPELEKLKFHHPGLQIGVNCQPDLFNIKGSAIHLKKSLINLLSNAAEALPEGGLVQVSTQNRYIDRMQKGYINVNSHTDKGTCMELYLPATRESVKYQEQAIPIDTYHGKGERILVVDDVQAQRDITSTMLIELGYRVDTVGSGEEAIAFLQDNTVNLIILDMIMDPGIDGLETYTRMQAFHPNQKTLIVSGFSETGRVKQAQSLGAGAYVKKPFSIETIGLAVRRELNLR
jgi:CheY-like chemotaxis protein/PAS domain-containing protein